MIETQLVLRTEARTAPGNYTGPRLDCALKRTLAEEYWLHEHVRVLITGPAGVGKTSIASALGNAACWQGSTALPPALAAARGPRDTQKKGPGERSLVPLN